MSEQRQCFHDAPKKKVNGVLMCAECEQIHDEMHEMGIYWEPECTK